MPAHTIVVFGAAGHTGRFVVDELVRRGFVPVLAGRDAARLAGVRAAHPGLATRVADVADAGALDRSLAGAHAVINCAGPFLDTAAPVIAAALRARIHYLDVAAEQATTLATFERFAAGAARAGVAVVPAMAFFGGLADLLASAAMAGRAAADEIQIAIALDRWHPTRGTRLTGERNVAPRVEISRGVLAPLAAPPPARTWQFPSPFGTQDVVGMPLSEIITISRHLRCPEVHTLVNRAPLDDLRSADTPEPRAIDDRGRSAQRFVMEVVVRIGHDEHRARAAGRDIYAITAPLVVEAVARILDGRATRTGVAAAGELFDARGFLHALAPDHLALELP